MPVPQSRRKWPRRSGHSCPIILATRPARTGQAPPQTGRGKGPWPDRRNARMLARRDRIYEVGTIQPLAEIARTTRERGILFHTDAAQSLGKIPTKVADLGVDMLSIAGHTLYAPKGVGSLYIRHGVD